MTNLINGSTDFFGLNHYGTSWGSDNSANLPVNYSNDNYSYFSDIRIKSDHEGLPRAQSSWLYAAGWGLRKLLTFIKDRYNNPDIYITESGWSLYADNVESGVHDD